MFTVYSVLIAYVLAGSLMYKNESDYHKNFPQLIKEPSIWIILLWPLLLFR